jgi:hypothetical protein
MAGQMLAILCLRGSPDLRTLLEGEWTISNEARSLYTIAFHRANPEKSSVLNATLWRDSAAVLPAFTLAESPLIAQLQFSFSGALAGSVASILPPSGPLCAFAFGANLTASATVNGSAVTASLQAEEFAIAFGNLGSFKMRRDAAPSRRTASPATALAQRAAACFAPCLGVGLVAFACARCRRRWAAARRQPPKAKND